MRNVGEGFKMDYSELKIGRDSEEWMLKINKEIFGLAELVEDSIWAIKN
jgi:hypothetical protein